MTTPTHTHKFQEAGLGLAPFRFVRVEVRKFQACQGAPVQPAGTCDYCGTAIMECCIIRSADGQEFVVGNECVRKTGDAGLVDLAKRAVSKLKTEARHAREAERIQETAAKLQDPAIRAKMTLLPSPNAHHALQGRTRLDWAEWMLKNAGNAGKMDVARYLDGLTRLDLTAEQAKEAARLEGLRKQEAEDKARDAADREAWVRERVQSNTDLMNELKEHALYSIEGGYPENFAAAMVEKLRTVPAVELPERAKDAILSILCKGFRGQARRDKISEMLWGK